MSGTKLSQDGYVKVHITDDGMAAYVTVYGPKNGGCSVTMQEVLAAIKDEVVEGVDYGRLADARTRT